MALDSADLFGYSSPLTLISVAASDDMAKLLLSATCGAVRWSRRKNFMLFLYTSGYIILRNAFFYNNENFAAESNMVNTSFGSTALNRVFNISDITRYICLYL